MVVTQSNGTKKRRWGNVLRYKSCGCISGGKAITTKSNTRGRGQRLRGRRELHTPNFKGMDTEQKISAEFSKKRTRNPELGKSTAKARKEPTKHRYKLYPERADITLILLIIKLFFRAQCFFGFFIKYP